MFETTNQTTLQNLSQHAWTFLVHHFCSVDRPLPLPCQGAARPTQHSELPLRLLSTSADFTWRIDPAEFLLKNREHDDKPASLCRTLQYNNAQRPREETCWKKCSKAAGFKGKTEGNMFFCSLAGPFAKTLQYSRKKKWSQSKRLRKSDDPPVLLCPPLHS